MVGSVAIGVVLSGVVLRDGGPPMIPPSMNFMVGEAVWKRLAISRALRGEMALRSR